MHHPILVEQKCFEACSEEGAPVMGLQYGYWCFCGWEDVQSYMVNGESTCGMRCIGGQDDEMCGESIQCYISLRTCPGVFFLTRVHRIPQLRPAGGRHCCPRIWVFCIINH